ncbi:hypothetical protein ACIQ1J_02630 [Streptomyces sp. NPDC097107]|uniref:hypothetical protein n=1 Tax=Streptomyces sp. NPDC097107 TaxID=3366089 RepID=UPI0038053FFD
MHEAVTDIVWAEAEHLTLPESAPDPEVDRDPIPGGQRLPYGVDTVLLPGASLALRLLRRLDRAVALAAARSVPSIWSCGT